MELEMSPYQKIKLEIARVEQMAEKARLAERPQVITSINALISTYDLTFEDLGIKAAKTGLSRVDKPAPLDNPLYTGLHRSPLSIPRKGEHWTAEQDYAFVIGRLTAIEAAERLLGQHGLTIDQIMNAKRGDVPLIRPALRRHALTEAGRLANEFQIKRSHFWLSIIG